MSVITKATMSADASSLWKVETVSSVSGFKWHPLVICHTSEHRLLSRRILIMFASKPGRQSFGFALGFDIALVS